MNIIPGFFPILLQFFIASTPTYKLGMTESEFIAQNKPVKIIATSFVKTIYKKDGFKDFFYFKSSILLKVDTTFNLSFVTITSN